MIDLETFRRIYKLGKSLSLNDIQVLLTSAKRKSFAPGEYLMEVNGTDKKVYVIRKGLVRAFQITDRGDEITTGLRWENQIVANRDMILFDQPSQLYFEALEATDVLFMDYELLQSIVSQNPKLESSRKYVLRVELKRAYQRIDSFVLLSPEERYLAFIKENPDIVNRVPDKYIANVLGITPVSLSRIRKRIAERKR